MATISDARRERFALAALRMLSQQQPRLAPRGGFSLLPSGPGGRNHLFAGALSCGPAVLKVRSDPYDSIAREASALQALPSGLAPALLTTFQPWRLLEEAIHTRELRTISALDLPVGEALLMEQWSTQTLPPNPTEDHIQATAQSLRRLHQDSSQSPHPLGLPQTPTAILRVIQDHIEDLFARKLLCPSLQPTLHEAVQQAQQTFAASRKTFSSRKIRKLCHGDLRWHNLIEHGEDIALLDLEDAGMGDPAVDLAMMTCRTPLSWYQELSLLDAYSAQSTDRHLLARYFVLRPLVGLLCALGALLDLADVHEGIRPINEPIHAYITRRLPALKAEFEDALRRILGPTAPLPLEAFASFQSAPPTHALTDPIAIDGTSASLKSPFAQALASALQLPYYNTGTAYRYAALWAHCHHKSPDNANDRRALVAHLKRAQVTLQPDGSLCTKQHHFTNSLLAPPVEASVAQWAQLPTVRNALAPTFSTILDAPAVIEGRDIGTHLLPDATHKLFIDAPLRTRARALAERTGLSNARAQTLLKRRDTLDKTRQHAPLQAAADAIHLQPTSRNFSLLLQQTIHQLTS